MNYRIPLTKIRMSINNLKERIEKIENPVIDEQTIMFWNLQLQFMDMERSVLRAVFDFYRDSKAYRRNEHTKKLVRLLNRLSWSEAEYNCLATHLALQLSGLT